MIKVKGLFRSFPVDLCSEEFGSVHMMGRGDLLCDIYHVEIPRVSLEALRALEGLAPPVSFITGFFPPAPSPPPNPTSMAFGSRVGVGIHLLSKYSALSGVRARAGIFF